MTNILSTPDPRLLAWVALIAALVSGIICGSYALYVQHKRNEERRFLEHHYELMQRMRIPEERPRIFDPPLPVGPQINYG